ncbi:MAG: hypothetical protein IPH12_12985 [Saprospirales bacterium]|nr:hypothetical protein [Saprospirales bacterium]
MEVHPPEVSQQPTLPAKENILKKDLIDNAPAASGQEPLAPESRIPIANAIASAGAPETPGMAANFSILRSLALRELPQSVPGTLRPAAEPAPVAAPIIRPHRERKSRFRAGVQASVAAPAPAEQGVSWLRGAGISAEYTPVRNLWLTAASDWMSFDIHRSKNITEPFFPGKPPKPKGHHNELVAVVAHPRQQQISLGIRYALPLRFWVRPSVRIAHNWLLENPGVFSFGFEDKDPGHPTPAPPELIASRPGSRLVQNIWRFGAALERETPFWVFRAGVDWVDASAASEPAFHSVVLYTGIQYKL